MSRANIRGGARVTEHAIATETSSEKTKAKKEKK